MASKFGFLLRKLRKEHAELSQQELGQLLNVHASMISRYEKDPKPPSPHVVQRIVTALAPYDVPRNKLDELWESAGFPRSKSSENPESDTVGAYVDQAIAQLSTVEQRRLLGQAVQNTVESHLGYFATDKAVSRRKWKQAGEAIERLRTSILKHPEQLYLLCDERLGDCRSHEGRLWEAVQNYETALLELRQQPDDERTARVLIKLGDTLRRLGSDHWQVACDRYRNALEIYQQLGQRERMADCQRKIGGVYWFEGQPDKLLEQSRESRSLAEQLGYSKGIYKGLQHEAWAHEIVGEWGLACQMCEEALEIVRNVTDDPLEMAKSLLYLGDAYRIERRHDEALHVYKAGLTHLDKPDDDDHDAEHRRVWALIQLGIAKTYLKKQGRELEAREALNESLDSLRSIDPETFHVARVLSEQGDCLLKLGRHVDAERKLRRAAELLKRSGNSFFYVNSLASVCELYLAQRDFPKLYKTAEDAFGQRSSFIAYSLGQIAYYVGCAKVEERLLDEAVRWWQQALEKCINFNEVSANEMANKIGSTINKKTPDISQQSALELLDAVALRLRNSQIEPSCQDSFDRVMRRISETRIEIETLMPVK